MRALSLVAVTWLRVFLPMAAVTAAFAQPFAYVSNQLGNNVTVVNQPTNTVLASIPYSGGGLSGLAITPNGSYLYVTAQSKNCVVVMNTASHAVVTTIPVGTSPVQAAVTPNGAAAYIVNDASNNVSVVNTATNSVTATIPVGAKPVGIVITPDGTTALALNLFSSNISVISTASNSVVATWTTLSGPSAAAVSPNGSVVYVANQYANALTVYSLPSGSITATITGFTGPNSVAVTPNGSYLYVTNANASTVSVVDTSSNQIVATINVGLLPTSIAVSSDGSTAYVTNGNGYSLSVISTAGKTVTDTIARVGIFPFSVVLSGAAAANIAKTGGDGQSVLEGNAFPIPLQVTLTDGNGNPVPGAAVTFSVTPGSAGAGGMFSGIPPMPILSDQNGVAAAPQLTANGIPGTFTVTASANAIAATFVLTNLSPAYALGTNSMTLGSGAGNSTLLLAANAPWTAASNASWMHVTAGSESGTGSALIHFSYDANSNPVAQTATLTIAGLTLGVSQAGANYTPVAPVTALASSGLNSPQGLAVDSQGNVFIADTGNNAIKQWSAANQQVTTLACPELNAPASVAVDTFGNVYFTDTGNNAVKEWNASTQQVTTLASSGLNAPSGVAVDAQANVYFADTGNGVIKEWQAASQLVSTLVSQGLIQPSGIALDVQGNVYIANSGNHAIDEWSAASRQMSPLIASGLNLPSGLAVDGQGNVYVADRSANAVEMWSAASQQVSTLVSSGLLNPAAVAVDALGNVYIADTGNGAIKKLTLAYVALSAAGLHESAAAGADSFTAQVLPVGTPLSATSNAPWLTITSLTGGSINFAFQANTSTSSRTAVITLLGIPVTVAQAADAPGGLLKTAGDGQSTALGQAFPLPLQVMVTDATGLPLQGVGVMFTVLPGPGGASGTFAQFPSMPVASDQNGYAAAPLLTANNTGGVFTVVASASGISVFFTLTNFVDTLGSPSTIVGAAAGSNSVFLAAAGAWTANSNGPWLHLPANSGTGSALMSFNYDANPDSSTRTGTLTLAGLTFTVTQTGVGFTPVVSISRLAAAGLKNPQGVAADAQGNVYIADTGNNAIKEWNSTTRQIVTLISAGLNAPAGVAVDKQGTVYIADKQNNAIKEWSATTQQVTILVSSGLNGPSGLAVDTQGNVYFSDTGNNAVKEWVAASQQVTTLISAGLSGPQGVAVDALGNIYVADTNNNAIKQWNAAHQTVSQLLSTGLNHPSGVAVDGAGYVDITDNADNALNQWNPATQQLTTLVSPAFTTHGGVALDAQGNIYISSSANNTVGEVVLAYLSWNVTSLTEGPLAGTDSVSVQVLPASTPWTAAADQAWLKINSTAGGVIGFSFTANTALSSRVAHITVLGQQVTVNQAGDTPTSIAKTAGTGESTVIGQIFPINLGVRIKDAAGKPVAGAPVTFVVIPGAHGATATFAPAPPMPILTNSSGSVTAPALTAGTVAGVFTVNASTGGLSTVFTLKISAQ